jgi:UDP-N-acetyl-D-mannosaminuronic acid transferase (WecB/TagA/CpsF family)
MSTDPAEGFQRILGVRFYNGTVEGAVNTMLEGGGLLVVPAAPALVDIQYDETYRAALVRADLAIADSGFMVLLWRMLRGQTISRISGLTYLKCLLEQPVVRGPGQFFFVLPTLAAKEKTEAWWAKVGGSTEADHFYIAPRYGPVVIDEELRAILEAHQPRQVVIAVGGGVQEKLGLYLRGALSYRPAIYCIGAALGFLTGDQKPIPDWADRLYLGWLLRLARNPRLYLRRFWAAHELPGLIKRYGSALPPLVGHSL